MEKVSIDKLMSPTIKALRNLGGSGHISEIYEEVIKLEKFDEETLAIPRSSTKDNRTMVEYNLAWARTYLKRAGYLENSSRSVWSLTDEGRKVRGIDSQEVVKKRKIRRISQWPSRGFRLHTSGRFEVARRSPPCSS